MLNGEIRSIVIAIVAATVLAPLLGWWLSRVFPPKSDVGGDPDTARHRLRNQIIEYSGVVFGIAGIALAFLMQGSTKLEPTVRNVTLILSFFLLFMIGGIAALTALLGDRNAECFLAYFERERHVSRAGVRMIAKTLVIAAVAALRQVLLAAVGAVLADRSDWRQG
jgi:hypothetical protein